MKILDVEYRRKIKNLSQMELDPNHMKNLMVYIRDKEVLNFTQYLRDNGLEFKTFVDTTVDDGLTLLMRASYFGQKGIVQKLLDIGSDVNLTSHPMWTALMFAAHSGHVDIVRMLLEKGAHIDAVNSLGSTALVLATSKGHTEVVRALLEENANIHIENNAGWTAREIAEHKKFSEIKDALTNREKCGRRA